MKIKSILVSQPKPADISKTPFADMMKKYGVNFTFEKFIKLDDVTASSSNCCFLTCIQISQEAGQVVWYSISLIIFHSLL